VLQSIPLMALLLCDNDSPLLSPGSTIYEVGLTMSDNLVREYDAYKT